MIRLAHTYVCQLADQCHEHVYSAEVRDRAQTSRDFLLAALFEAPGDLATIQEQFLARNSSACSGRRA